jgi:molybdenum cofactor synthesis domain-containing protein
MFTVGILTISDRAARGERVDESGPAARSMLAGGDAQVKESAMVPDERERIAGQLKVWADEVGLDVVLTTGGTGLGPRDVTPEATQDVIERAVPGLGELLRRATFEQSSTSVLSRGLAGVRGHTLIVNLPGSPRAVRECLAVLLPLLPHAVSMLRGGDHETHMV